MRTLLRFTLPAVLGATAVAISPAQAPPQALVNVTDTRFGAGCPAPADPYGKRDSTCAIHAALLFAEGAGTPGAGYPVLYFPHGLYKVAGTGYSSALTLTKAVSLRGDGAATTVIMNTSATAATLTYLKAQECSQKPGYCPLSVEGLSFVGQGHTTAGGLIEISSTNTGTMRNVVLGDTGGIALNLQGSSERWYFSDMEISNARWPVLLEGDPNETYFNRVNVLNGGEAGDGYCYSVNCPGGKRIEQGVWRPDPHSAVFLDGDNVHWANSSIKSTEAIGGIRLAPTTSSLTHTYIEGFPWGGQPRANHAVAAPGKAELGHLTAAISTSALDIPVDDAGWQPLYTNDPAQAHGAEAHSYTNSYAIFPADYSYKSQEPSRAVPGITRGTFEGIQVSAFSGDGQAHLLRRGQNAIAWPAGSVIEQAAPNGYGVLRLEENHFNSLGVFFSQRYPSGCNDTEQQAHWTSSPSELCAEVIAGLVPDGFMVPFPQQDYVHNTFALDLVDNSIYIGGSESDGEGWVKVPGNATLTINEGDEPLRSFVDAGTALQSYSNGAARVQIVSYGGGPKPVSALAYVADPSAGVRFSPQEGFYEADVIRDGALAHQYLHSQCWYGTSPGSAAGSNRVCAAGNAPVASPSAAAATSSALARYSLRDWQINSLAPRGQPEDCKSHDGETGDVHFSNAADVSLLVSVGPNPGAAVVGSAAIAADRTKLTVRLCNTSDGPVRWVQAPVVTVTQLP